MTLQTVAGFPTHVETAGRGVRRALFIHCTLARAGAWSRVQAELLGKLAMTAFDRPGHGQSAGWAGEGGAVALLDLTARIAAELAGKPTDIVGHSFGAIVGLRLAMTRPDLVRSLTLIEPPLVAALRETPAHAAHAAFRADFEAALAEGDRMRAAAMFNDAMNPETPWSGLPEAAREGMARRIDLIAVENPVTMDDAAGLLAPGRLEAIKAPVLLMQGTLSPPVLTETMQALALRLPKARRVLVGGAGHMAPLTHPVNVAGEIAAFLKV
ncbi:MAG: alpha/beta hydrolase [Alphaproteobacteria bacterium]|nr:MAG: alpha/beta hydrolase [Alphaproteobacteria bacterium]